MMSSQTMAKLSNKKYGDLFSSSGNNYNKQGHNELIPTSHLGFPCLYLTREIIQIALFPTSYLNQ